MSTMIALVGDQPLPNFLPIRYYQPDNVLLVYTEQKKKQYEYLEATLQKVARLNIYELDTDAFYIHAIVQRLNEELTYLLGPQPPVPITLPLIFNLTGGTKAMSLAAYQVAQLHSAEMIYLQSEGKDTRVYHSTWAGQQLQPIGSELVPECLELQDVFDLHLGPGNWQKCGPSKNEGGPFEELVAARLRAQNYEVMSGVRTLNDQIEVDIAVRSRNQYGIIEAKMGHKGRRLDGVKQLGTAVPLLGTYSRAFYVITIKSDPRHKALTDALGIEVISLPGYDAVTNLISPADETELLSRIEDAFNGISGAGAPYAYS